MKGGFALLVELHRKGSASKACAAGLFIHSRTFPNLIFFCDFDEVENRQKLRILNTLPFFPYQQNGVKTYISLFSP